MNIINKIKDLLTYGLDYSDSNGVEYDYYNGSDNDLENIFLELLKHADRPINVFNRETYSDRIRFLAGEGLHILSFYNGPESFKISKEEADAVILNLAKTTKKKRVTPKKKK
jgi:hypothetical protein